MGGIAACCCVALVFAIKHLYNSVFCLFLSILSQKKKKVWQLINRTEWSMMPTFPSLTCLFNKALKSYIQGTSFLKICLMCVGIFVYGLI